LSNNHNQNNKFDDFQLEEYKNISTSHFESIKQVSVFFRYYLLLLSAPALLLTLVGTGEGNMSTFFKGNLDKTTYDIVFAYLLLISAAGLCIFLFIINIRHDAILYARKVNKVRKYFYENSSLKVDDYHKYLGLPIVESKPRYTDNTIFFPLIIVFTLINSAFLFSAFYFRMLHSDYVFNTTLFELDLPLSRIYLWIVFFNILGHIILWKYLSYRRENFYLKSFAFGVDIDGVVNNQTEHFAEWLYKLRGKRIDTEKIKEIPVRLNKGLNVDDFDEQVVFNCKEYWEGLREKENALKTINDIHKKFGYKIFVYTYRPWGQMSDKVKNEIIKQNYTPLLKNDIVKITKSSFKNVGINTFIINNWFSSILYWFIPTFLKIRTRVTIEKGNSNISDTRFSFIVRNQTLLLNRFQGAKRNRLKFFIEDTPENAIKLANLVDYVFLMNQPYNNDENRYRFQKNIIRVDSWNEVYSHLKQLS